MVARQGEKRKSSKVSRGSARAHGQTKTDSRPRPLHHIAERLESRLLLATGPVVESINRVSPAVPLTSSPTLGYIVIFSEPVTGVDPSDFSLSLTGSVTATTPVSVAGGRDVYAVTINNVSGTGTLTLNLIDDGAIKDYAGNPLQPGGQPNFQPQQTFAAGSGPEAVAVADLNGDGKPDVVIANQKSNTISVLLGNGDGTLKPQITYAVGAAPHVVVINDVNGDGVPDLLIGDNYDISIFLGNGNGTFRPPYSVPSAVETQFAVADMNGDGKTDLVESGYFFPGDGTGHFTFVSNSQRFSTGLDTGDVVADVNNDGIPDVVCNTPSVGIQVALGNGNGTFKSLYTIFGYNSVYRVNTVTVADFNGDHNADVLVGGSLFLGNGDGTFKSPIVATGGSVAADVNGDGKVDLVSTGSVAFGNGDGTFKAAGTFAAGPDATAVAVADLNGDGHPDLITANYDGNSAGILLGASNGDFTGQTFTVVPYLDTINETPGNHNIGLTLDPDHLHIDWASGATRGQVSINDPAGLTINSNGGVNTINLTGGSALPDLLKLNGTFTLSTLSGANPLAGKTIDLRHATLSVFFYPAAPSPDATFVRYIQNAYDHGNWDGTATPTTGVITSSVAESD